MKPGTLRYLADSCLFAVLSALAVVGLLLAHVVPRGPDPPHTFLGIRRHDWIDIHYGLAIVFVALLLVHLILNWGWIVGSSKRLLGPRWSRRLLALALAWFPILAVAWLLAYC